MYEVDELEFSALTYEICQRYKPDQRPGILAVGRGRHHDPEAENTPRL